MEEPENTALEVEKILKPFLECIDSVLMDILRSMQKGKIPYDSDMDELIQGHTANANFSSEMGEVIESEVNESFNVNSDEPSGELNQSYHLNVFNEYRNWLISDTHALQDSIRSATVSGALKRYKDL